MALSKRFDQFASQSAVSVMMRGILEYSISNDHLDSIFRGHAKFGFCTFKAPVFFAHGIILRGSLRRQVDSQLFSRVWVSSSLRRIHFPMTSDVR